jgi:hypothetical protein
MRFFDQRQSKETVIERNSLTCRNSLSSWGGYRGGCGPGTKDGGDLLRRTPSLPRLRVLLPRAVVAGRAWDRTKVMDGSVGSGERILLLSFLYRDLYKTAGGRTERGAVEWGKAMRATTTQDRFLLCSESFICITDCHNPLTACYLRCC